MHQNKLFSIIFSLSLIMVVVTSCGDTTWKYSEKISLGEITPIGIVYDGENFWISDGDNNQVVQTDLHGKVLDTQTDFERPMHMAYKNGQLYIPQYGNDSITILKDGVRTNLSVEVELDAPAGVDISDKRIAIADFYNHRLVLKTKSGWKTIGKKGRNGPAEFHYPTDVHFTENELYVADAYNNRIQVFDLDGKHLKTFGRSEKMNASTGIYVWEEQVFVTDFENDRVLIFDKEGTIKQVIEEGLENPTDLIVVNDELLVINYKGRNIVKYTY